MSLDSMIKIFSRCALWLINVLLFISLGIQLAILASIYHHGDLVIPEFALKRLEQRLAKQNAFLRCGQIEVDFHGNLLLTHVEAGSLDFSEPLLHAEQIRMKVFPWALLWGSLHIETVQITRLSLYLPAVLSASGTREDILTHGFLSARRSGRAWIIDRMDALMGPLEARVSGSLEPDKVHSSPLIRGKAAAHVPAIRVATPPDWKSWVHGFARFSQWIEHFEAPMICIDLSTRDDWLCMDAEFRWEAFSPVHEITGGKGALFLSLDRQSGSGAWRMAKAPSLYVRSITWKQFSADTLHLTAADPADRLLAKKLPGELSFALSKLDGGEIGLESLHGLLDLREYPRVQALANLRNADDWMSWQGHFDLSQSEGTGIIAGQLDPMPYLAPFTNDIKHLQTLRFVDPVHLQSRLTVDAGKWRLDDLNVTLNRAEIEALSLTYGYLSGHASEQEVAIDYVYLATERYHVEGRYYQDLKSMDYRYLLTGRIVPTAISVFIDEGWWDSLWERFSFGDSIPDASIDLRGRYHGGIAHSQMYGKASLNQFRYHDVDVYSASTKIWQLGADFNLIDLDIDTPGGDARVNLQWRHPKTGEDTMPRTAFSGATRLPLAEAAEIIGGEAGPYFSLFDLQAPPEVKIFGVIVAEDAAGEGGVFLNLVTDIDDPVTFHHYRFDDLYFQTLVSPGNIDVKNADFGLGGGRGKGWIQHKLQQDQRYHLALALELEDARYAELLDSVPLMAGLKPDLAEDAANGGEYEPPGIISGHLQIEGVVGEADSYTGQGEGSIRDASLGRLHLLGMFSRFLRELGLPLGVVAFKQAQSPFEIAHGLIHFSDLEITGTAARISAHGNIGITTSSLDLAMNLYPLGGLRVPLLSEFLNLVNPVSNVLEIKVTGTLQDPDFSASIHPLRAVTGRQNHIRLENPADN